MHSFYVIVYVNVTGELYKFLFLIKLTILLLSDLLFFFVVVVTVMTPSHSVRPLPGACGTF